MNRIISFINVVANNERKRANKVHPLFHSDHEGIAVIEEELFEAQEEMKNVETWFDEMKKYCFKDVYDETTIDLAIRHCEYACAELVQVLAMLTKFKESREDRIEKSEKEERW